MKVFVVGSQDPSSCYRKILITGEYIKQCSRNDAALNQCLIGTLHHLRPYLASGIADIKVMGQPSRYMLLTDDMTVTLSQLSDHLTDVNASAMHDKEREKSREMINNNYCIMVKCNNAPFFRINASISQMHPSSQPASLIKHNKSENTINGADIYKRTANWVTYWPTTEHMRVCVNYLCKSLRLQGGVK